MGSIPGHTSFTQQPSASRSQEPLSPAYQYNGLTHPETGTNAANFIKIAQGVRPCGAFIFHIFDQISKMSVLGILTVAPMG